MVFRLFVEKKRGLDGVSKNLLGYIRNYISVEPETELRLFDRYDFDGLTNEEFELISKGFLVDENTENSFIDYIPLTTGWKSFSVTNKKGKYSERIANLKSFARSYGISGHYKVVYSKVVALSGILNDYKLNEIENLLIDKRIFELCDESKPLSLEENYVDFGDTVVDEDFLEKNDIQIYQYLNKTSLKMTKETLCIIRDYFKSLKRNPTLVELYSIDNCLSLKCRPENTCFTDINFEDVSTVSPLKITLEEFINMREQARIDKKGEISLNEIAMAGYDYMKQKGQIQDIVIENETPLIGVPVDVNGVVEQYLISFKAGKSNKTDEFDVLPKNTFNMLEPYQSLVFDLKPVIEKDSFSSARDYNNTASADDITIKVANMNKRLGIPSALGGQIYSSSVKNPINFSATVFAGTKSDYASKISVGDAIIMLGSKFKIADFNNDGFTQQRNSVLSEKIIQFFKTVENFNYIKKTLDLSQGMVAGILNELTGADIDINRILAPKDLPLAHLALSIKSNRAAVIVSKDRIDDIKAVCAELGLSSHIIGEVIDEPRLSIRNGKKQVADIMTEFISALRNYNKRKVLIKDKSNKKLILDGYAEEFDSLSRKDAFLLNLKNITVSSKKGISSYFDSTVGAGCVLAPFGGKTEMTPSDAFVTKIPTDTGNTNTVTSVSYGCNPKISNISPYHGAAFSIMESISKIVATGSNSINVKLGICQNVSDPKGFETKYSDLFSSAFGAFATESGMNIPAVSYDLSVDKNSENQNDFSCFAMAVSKANEVITPDFKSAGSTVILIPMPIVEKTGLPDYDKAKVIYRQIHYLSQNGKVLSAGVVNEGGIAALVAKMSFGNSIGVEFEDLDKNTLFSAKTASIVVETANPGAFSGMDIITIGKTISEPIFDFGDEKVTVSEALNAYTGAMQGYYPTRTNKRTAMAKIESYACESRPSPKIKVAVPKVVIPVFTGISGANDLARSFKNSGGEVEIYCVNPKDYTNSLKSLSDKIDNSQIICLPSGSLSKYSAEFGYSVMTNPIIRDSVTEFLEKDGLIIGFEEGFDILLRTGLLTDGKYNPGQKGAYLSESVIGMPSAGFVKTKVISDKSVWMSLCRVGDTHKLAVYNKKSRFVADEETMLSLMKNNQITAQYVDKSNKPAAKMPFNPDSSICAIESISSPDGRILGKTALPQRKTLGCFVNIPDNKDQRIFEAGINYFKD